MPPIPCEGTGYHRYAFALLRQNSRIEGLETLPARDLKARTWSTGRFMSQHDLSIRGLAFFQAQWDLSVSDVFCELGKSGGVLSVFVSGCLSATILAGSHFLPVSLMCMHILHLPTEVSCTSMHMFGAHTLHVDTFGGHFPLFP